MFFRNIAFVIWVGILQNKTDKAVSKFLLNLNSEIFASYKDLKQLYIHFKHRNCDQEKFYKLATLIQLKYVQLIL